MNRSDTAWSLKAVSPHCGTTAGTDSVVSAGGWLYATDTYSVGLARTDLPPLVMKRREAERLERWLRPSNAAERAQQLICRVDGPELHVGVLDGDDLADSAVFDLSATPPAVSLSGLRRLFDALAGAPQHDGKIVFNPSLLAKFDKAKRDVGDVVRLYPKALPAAQGATTCLVTVGPAFVGAVHGIVPAYHADDSAIDLLFDLTREGVAA